MNRPAMHPLTSTGALRAWWAVLMVVVASLLVGAFSIGFTVHQQRLSDQRWCDLLVTLDTPAAPPTNERGRIIQDRIGRLADAFGCENGSVK